MLLLALRLANELDQGCFESRESWGMATITQGFVIPVGADFRVDIGQRDPALFRRQALNLPVEILAQVIPQPRSQRIEIRRSAVRMGLSQSFGN